MTVENCSRQVISKSQSTQVGVIQVIGKYTRAIVGWIVT